MPIPESLPIAPLLPRLERLVGEEGRAVLVAPPGAGKTTTVPLALLDAEWLHRRRIVMLEPRRLAARAAAHRIATLLGEDDVGGTVGYRVRMDTRVGPNTRIEVVTEGVLTRMLHSDPALEGIGAVVFDEFHERSLHSDLGLALTLQARELLRPDLRLLVMSATLAAEPVARLLGGAPIVRSEGREHPVDTRWRRSPVEGWIEPAVARTVLRALDEAPGDVLVFLPGAREIRHTARLLDEAELGEGVTVHPLSGSLPRAEQDRAIAPAPPGQRKVVLATAIAETSLTIEGVRVVIDAGLMRVPRFDPGTGMSRLETVRVTRDSADQRRGRAGRTAPGVCYRLWTRNEDRGLVPARRPEILEADLAPLALDLAAWGATADELKWLDPPPEAALGRARELLKELELVADDGALTEHGGRVAGLGTHPRIGHMLVRGVEEGMGATACDLAALLGERDVIMRRDAAPDVDLRLRLDLLRGAPAVGVRGHEAHRGALARAVREARRWRRVMGAGRTDAAGDTGLHPPVGEVAALAYPDRVGRLRKGDRGRFLLANGRGAQLDPSQSLAGEEWLVAVEVEGGRADGRIFRAAPLDPAAVERLFASRIRSDEEVEWDAEAGRARARRVRRLGAIEFGEAPLPDPDPARVGAAVLEGLRERGLDALGWTKDSEQLRDRLRFLHRLEPEAWPDVSDEALLEGERLLPFLSTGVRSLEDLRRVDPTEALLLGLEWDQRERLERWAPTHLEVPSGSRIRLDYSDADAPVLAVRLQEVFGMTETPRIAGGRVPLTVHLLSPAHRPVQVTRDLASFWRETYFDVRKDLRGRYPKHHWPDDPLAATPTRRTRGRG